MKSLRNFGIALIVLLVAPLTNVRSEVDFNFFYEELDPYGDWVEVEGLGYCWQPNDVEDEWRPYWDGSWAHSDAGWTWVSNEEWGDVTYHYGRWTRVRGYGWLWVPGYEWAPAWVSWRENDDYVGWAPLPPEVEWAPRSGITFGVSFSTDVGPSYYNFCPRRYIGYESMRRYVEPDYRNVEIIENSVNITNITTVNNTIIYNDGPDYDGLMRVSEVPVRRVRLQRVRSAEIAAARAEGRRLRNQLRGDTLEVVAPEVRRVAHQAREPKRVKARVRREQIDRGWDSVGDEERVRRIKARVAEQANSRPAPIARRRLHERPDEVAAARALRQNQQDRRNEQDAQANRQRQDNLKPFLPENKKRDDQAPDRPGNLGAAQRAARERRLEAERAAQAARQVAPGIDEGNERARNAAAAARRRSEKDTRPGTAAQRIESQREAEIDRTRRRETQQDRQQAVRRQQAEAARSDNQIAQRRRMEAREQEERAAQRERQARVQRQQAEGQQARRSAEYRERQQMQRAEQEQRQRQEMRRADEAQRERQQVRQAEQQRQRQHVQPAPQHQRERQQARRAQENQRERQQIQRQNNPNRQQGGGKGQGGERKKKKEGDD